MKIIIEYESSWRNSFLDGSNNEELPEKGRKYIAAKKFLTKEEDSIKKNITKDTIMGILKASQKRTKRAALIEALMSKQPANTKG